MKNLFGVVIRLSPVAIAASFTPEPLIPTPEGSIIAPLRIEGLPGAIEALGNGWRRKQEFHLTAVTRSALERAGLDADRWRAVEAASVGRELGPITPREELRIARDADRPGLETVVVMVDCDGIDDLYGELRQLTGVEFTPPPAHVTLYSSDPATGIGLADAAQLRERAPELHEGSQRELRAAIRFAEVFSTA